jgi:hypothetical protein
LETTEQGAKIFLAYTSIFVGHTSIFPKLSDFSQIGFSREELLHEKIDL